MWYIYTKESLEALLLSCVHLYCNPTDCSLPVSLSMGFPRQEYWSGLPYPSPEDLPNPGMETESPELAWGKLESTCLHCRMGFLVVQMVKSLPAVQETWVGSLGQEDALEKGIVTHSSFLAWIIPWTADPGGLQPMRSRGVGHDWVTFIFALTLQNTQKIPSLGALGTSVTESKVGCLKKGKLVGSC